MPAPDAVNAGSPVAENSFAVEAERIRLAYAKRTAKSIYSMCEPAHRLAVEERERVLLGMLDESGFLAALESMRILEVGCGSGFWLREFVRWGARPENIFGVDLLPERIAQARQLCPLAVSLSCQNASDLGNLDASFDLVLQSTVFTSILDEAMKRKVAAEMLRVLRPKGIVVWYDFHVDNPSNPDVRGIGRREIARLFPGCALHMKKLTLAPPLGRPLARMSAFLYGAASAIKPLCTHYLGIIRKP
jgi:SAM-dependent methyltransferase